MTSKASRLSVLGLLIAIVAPLLACAGAPTEVNLPPQTLTEGPTSTAEEEAALVSSERVAAESVEPAPEEAVAETAVAAPASTVASEPDPNPLASRKHTIVIQASGASDATPRTLHQASESERERRAGANAPVAVITNQNLSDLAAGGVVTVVGDGSESAVAAAGSDPATASAPAAGTASGGEAGNTPSGTAAAPAAAGTAAAKPSPALTEEYWRGQALKIRLDWMAAVEEVDQLQADVADLRRRFYEEDDPFYRDNEIKPEWDRAIDRLQEARAEADAQERKLDRFLEEGRRSGALPGWLREGVEFEPPATPDRSPAGRRRSDDPWEPKVLEEEPRNP